MHRQATCHEKVKKVMCVLAKGVNTPSVSGNVNVKRQASD